MRYTKASSEVLGQMGQPRKCQALSRHSVSAASFFIRRASVPTLSSTLVQQTVIKHQLHARSWGAGSYPRCALALHLLSSWETRTTATDQGHTLAPHQFPHVAFESPGTTKCDLCWGQKPCGAGGALRHPDPACRGRFLIASSGDLK